MKAIITVGISGSGKSAWAASHIKLERANGCQWVEVNRDAIRFNVVEPGASWATYKFTGAKEGAVSAIAHGMITSAASRGMSVIVSDTNLNKGRRDALIDQLKELGFEVEIKVLDTSFEQCVSRDKKRASSVGEDVIYQQYQQFLEFMGRETYKPDELLPKAAIFDVDGTLADMEGLRKPFDWDKVGLDRVRRPVADMLRGYASLGYSIIILSGRDGVCRDLTIEWLDKHDITYNEFYIRTEGDTRKDTVIKEELFWEHIASRYNVMAVVDDRPCMIDLWHELKMPCVISVANHRIKF